MKPARLLLFSLFLLLVARVLVPGQDAPGAPGETARWTNGNKEGVGTANTTASKVWFTLSDGILAEVYYPTLDKANTRSLALIVTDGKSFAEIEDRDTTHTVERPDPKALVFRQVNTSKSGRYRITKTYVTDPDRDVLLIRVRFEPLVASRMRLYVLFDPSLNNSGLHDQGFSQGSMLISSESSIAAALASSLPFTRTSNGYLGTSDGWSELRNSFRLQHAYPQAVDGNVVQIGELPVRASLGGPFTLALAFGSDAGSAASAAAGSLQKGFQRTLAQYSAGWHAYTGKLKDVDPKYRDQYWTSAMVLQAHEDKTYRGAGAASLTIPWGDRVDASEAQVGGYHLVWARDLYHVTTAFLAMGDRESAERALDYLLQVQQKKDGSFPQNSWLDGRPFWGSLQMDEVSYPLILAYQLQRFDAETYEKHVKPAASFILEHGPATPQERWEEESGYSPSTIAAEIAGLVCAAEIARKNSDNSAAALWLAAARDWKERLPGWTATFTGPLAKHYFLRITQQGNPDAGEKLEINNGGGTYDEREIVDAGFLELVRLGIVPASDSLMRESLAVVDRTIKVETPKGPSWYRYNHDGYGEKAGGEGYDRTGIGRLWVLLTGERGEYALAAGEDARRYLEAMQHMANQGRMLSEQIWDRSESPAPHLRFGEGTGSATPLAWTNAQFIRLAIALREGRLPETPDAVAQFFRVEKRLGTAPRLSVTPISSNLELVPGQKIEIGVFADGGTVAVLADGRVTAAQPGSFKVPVEVGEREKVIAIGVLAPDGQTVFERITIQPNTGASATGFTTRVPAPDPKDPVFVERLKTSPISPLIGAPWATFLYRGAAKDIEVVGEFTDWDRHNLKMARLASSDTWFLSLPFPVDARIEYKYIVDGEWKLDPLNPNRKDNGVGGENSFFPMPEYHPKGAGPAGAESPHGQVESLSFPYQSGSRTVRVYLPPGYRESKLCYPVIYFNDGFEYQERARVDQILDRLVAAGAMPPAILVLIPPGDRMREYWLDPDYLRFMRETVVPQIDQRFRTIASPQTRAFAGVSLGGLAAAYAALTYPDVFGVVLSQSGAFSVNGGSILSLLRSRPRAPIRWYLDVGRFEGLIESNREFRRILESRGYAVTYKEWQAGHNWTHWGDTLEDALPELFRNLALPTAAEGGGCQKTVHTSPLR